MPAPIAYFRLLVLDETGDTITLKVVTPAKITTRTPAAVSWTATLSGGGLKIIITAKLEMDSYMSFEAMVGSSSSASVGVSDVQLIVQAQNAKRMLGMGVIGSASASLTWRWQKKAGIGNNRVWLGDTDAGVFVTPRGAGDDWTSPQCGTTFCSTR